MTPPPVIRGGALLAGTAQAFSTWCETERNEGKALLASLRTETDPSVILAKYDEALRLVSEVSARSSLAKEVHPDVAFRQAAEVCQQANEAYLVELAQDRALYDALVKVDPKTLDATTAHWLDKSLREFRRAGVDRDEATRKKVAALNDELVKLGQAFARHIRDAVPKLQFTVAELEGVPADWLAAHPVVDGKVTVTTDAPDAVPVMTYVKSAKVREQLYKANRNRGYPENVDVLKALIEKRAEFARTLGYASYAAYDTETKMVKSPEAAADFIEKGRLATEKRAQADLALLLARKRRDVPNAERVEPWEVLYYTDRVKTEQYDFDSQVLREYLEYGHVKNGVIAVASKMFGVTFVPVTDAKTWHPDVEVYDVVDTGSSQPVGRVYLDMHPREGKYKHAAQFGLTNGVAGKVLPEGTLVCNFPKPGGLMPFGDVETFFHEFGHLMHEIFAGHQKWSGISGIKTEWDFVEAPSMLLQEWPSDPAVLQTFARNAKGESLPPELLKKLKAAEEFGVGMQTSRQFFLSGLSLEVFRRAPGFDPHDIVVELDKKYPFIQSEATPGTRFELAFGHLEGYAASYYTYLWSTVIARDLQTRFDAAGKLNPAVAGDYRKKVLEPGGSRPASELVAGFLGRPYNFAAFEAWLNSGIPKQVSQAK